MSQALQAQTLAEKTASKFAVESHRRKKEQERQEQEKDKEKAKDEEERGQRKASEQHIEQRATKIEDKQRGRKTAAPQVLLNPIQFNVVSLCWQLCNFIHARMALCRSTTCIK